MRAVITAGGRVGGEYARIAGTAVKALALVRGRSMLDRCIDAVRGAGASEVAVIGGAEVRAACAPRVDRVVEEAPSGSENLVRALRAWPDDATPLLYATSDMPYVDGDSIAQFLEKVPPEHLALPLCEFADFSARFPAAPPYGITLAGERVVNGGVFYLPPGVASRVEDLALRFFEARKAPWKMAGAIGPAMLLKFLFRRLSIAELEGRARALLGINALGARGCRPELAYDADTDAEYEYARTHS